MEKFIDYLSLLLFFTGLGFSSFSISGTLICSCGLFFISIVKSLKNRDFSSFKRRPELLLLLLLLLLTSLPRIKWSVDEFFVLGKVLSHLLLLFIFLPPFEKYREVYKKGLLLSSLPSTVLSLYLLFTSMKTHFQSSGKTFLPGTQETAGVIFFFLTFELSFFLNCTQKKPFVPYLIFSIILKTVGVILTFSRTYFLALILLYFYGLVSSLKRFKLLRAIFILTILSTSILIVRVSGLRLKIENLANRDFVTNKQRICMWKEGMKAFLEKPFSGQGVQFFGSIFFERVRLKGGCENIEWVPHGKVVHDPHNLYLYFAVSCGIPGVVLYIFFLYKILKEFRRNSGDKDNMRSFFARSSVLYFLAVLFTGSLFDRHPFLDPIINYLFCSTVWVNSSFQGLKVEKMNDVR